MKTAYRNPLQSRIPGYDQNAVLKIIIASGIGFISYQLIWVVIKLANPDSDFFFTHIQPNVSLPSISSFLYKWWTPFTYGWTHRGFWELFSNMIWLYAFGSIVQMLVGYKQVIPLFVYALVIGGLFYEAAQFIPGVTLAGAQFSLGAQAGVISLAVAALTIAPTYRYYLTPTFSIPLVALACIFFFLIILNSGIVPANLFLLGGGALTGFGYIRLLQNGYQPSGWIYRLLDKAASITTPDEQANRSRQNVRRNHVLNKMQQNARKSVNEMRVDEILDKINQHGYNSLSNEEKEILMRASNNNS